VWYSALLLLAIAAFTATVLWLHWELLLRQADESLEAFSIAAANVVTAELAEHATLEQAAHEMTNVVPHEDYEAAIVDAGGTMLMGSANDVMASAVQATWKARTMYDSAGRPWRVMRRPAASTQLRFTVVIAMPLAAVEKQWRTLVNACAVGIPFVLALSIAGGWMLGRHGLRPLANMADQAREITAETPQARVAVPDAGAELDDVAASFNRVLDRLNTALATQRRFMADASHELRTPVSIMRTAADVTLAQEHRDELEYREALMAVSQQTSRLARLVDDMLVLARADAGGYPMMPAEVDLDAVVDDCVRELSSRAAAKSIRVTSRLEPISVTADEALLRRMFGNLLTNAVTYTPTGGAIDVTMAPRAGVVAIHIADTGPGIPVDDRERVFERFVRLDPARAEGGAGLGLAIARWVAEAHGGHVDLLTTGPDGSVFSATIPVSS
jgi:heavy metal sensor kinase